MQILYQYANCNLVRYWLNNYHDHPSQSMYSKMIPVLVRSYSCRFATGQFINLKANKATRRPHSSTIESMQTECWLKKLFEHQKRSMVEVPPCPVACLIYFLNRNVRTMTALNIALDMMVLFNDWLGKYHFTGCFTAFQPHILALCLHQDRSHFQCTPNCLGGHFRLLNFSMRQS